MSRLGELCRSRQRAGRRALVIYLTAGDPDLETSLAAAEAAVRGGADILEVGVPFSDPVADGPVIQRAMLRSLAQGGGFLPALELVRRLRQKTSVPIVLFGYANPWLAAGLEAGCRAAAAAGVDGVLVVDVPLEEAAPWRAAAAAAGLDWVGLVAPTTPVRRAAEIARTSSGFVYVVSMTGVTGGALADTQRLGPVLAAARAVAPAYVGFGVRDAASAQTAGRDADGVVVGSAVVAALEAGAAEAGPARVADLVGSLRSAIDALSQK